MADYGLIYQTQYDALNDGTVETYYDKIYKRDYSGPVFNVISAAAPAVHQWQTDEPLAAIKGSNVTLTLLNPGNLPLSNFAAVEDDIFRLDHYWGLQLLFTGYLVASDCTEPMIDITHQITLSFTDNLGLIKDVSLLQAAQAFGPRTSIDTTVQYYTPYILQFYDNTVPLTVGDTIILPANMSPGSFLITAITPQGITLLVTVAQPLVPFGLGGGVYGTVIIITPVDLTLRTPLAKVIRLCLLATDLQLVTNVYATLQPIGGSTGRWLEDTVISPRYYLSNTTWASCYDVLTQIFTRFNATMFQAEGVWNIVRSNEHRQYPTGAIPGFQYDADMVYIADIAFNDFFTTGYQQVTFPETGITKSLLRPFKFDQETFNYKIPVLLNNYNLQELGTMLSSTTTTITSGNINTYPFKGQGFNIGDVAMVNTYDFAADTLWLHIYDDKSYIVVISEVFFYGNAEKDRYVYQPKFDNGRPLGYQRFLNVQFNDIEVNMGDVFDFSFSIKCASSTGGDAVLYRIGFFLQVATGEYYQLITDAGPGSNEFKWNHFTLTPIQSIPLGVSVAAAEAENYFDYTLSSQAIQGKVPPFPVDGLLRIRVYGTNDTNSAQPNVDAIWKNIDLSLFNFINQSTQIVGQVHNSTQQPTIKNDQDTEIFLDDSPRNSINGTLFLSTFTGLLQDRTSAWQYPTTTTPQRLGQVTTYETLFQRRIQRLKLEGTMQGLVQPFLFSTETDLYFTSTGTVYIIRLQGIDPALIQVGTVITIGDTVAHDGTYTVTQILGTSPLTVRVAEPFAATPNQDNGLLQFTTYRHISLLTVIKYAEFMKLNFIFGMLNIDYRRNSFNGTLWELWDDDETDNELLSFYLFKYLYKTT